MSDNQGYIDTKRNESPSDVDKKKDHFLFDVLLLIKKINNNRKILILFTLAFFILGLITASIRPDEFISSAKILPEAQEAHGGGLTGIARQFGLSTALQPTNINILSAALYPDIVKSKDFMGKLIYEEVKLTGADSTIILINYISELQHRSLLTITRKYTIGLPVTIIRWFRDPKTVRDQISISKYQTDNSNNLLNLSIDENLAIDILNSRITINYNQLNGILTITTKMPDPYLAAQITNYIVVNLSDNVMAYRTNKAKENLNFIQARFGESKVDIDLALSNLASFRDQNRGELTATARIQEQRLQSDFNLAFNIHNSIAEQLAQARIKLQEETPILTILEKPNIPNYKSEPQRLAIIFVYITLGFVLGLISILVKSYSVKIRHELKTVIQVS